MHRLKDLGLQTAQALWFLPALLTALHVAVAIGLVLLDQRVDARTPFGVALESRLPFVFGIGAETARSILGTMAGALITAAGVTFSGVLVALSIASSQYTSRILRVFTADRLNQSALGFILGGFTFCMLVLQCIGLDAAGTDYETFVPELATAAALPIGLLGVSSLVLFVHSVARSIQASEILAEVSRETEASIRRMFPSQIADGPPAMSTAPAAHLPTADDEARWSTVHATASGYLRTVDGDALLSVAEDLDATIELEHRVGAFVIDTTPLARYVLLGTETDAAHERMRAVVTAAHAIGAFRTVEQDAAFGIRQMVDIALRALSPGVNDTTTAVMAIHRISAAVRIAAAREPAAARRFTGAGLRLTTRSHDLESLIQLAFEQIASNAEGNADATRALIEGWIVIVQAIPDDRSADACASLVASAQLLLSCRPKKPLPIGSWESIEASVTRLTALSGAPS